LVFGSGSAARNRFSKRLRQDRDLIQRCVHARIPFWRALRSAMSKTIGEFPSPDFFQVADKPLAPELTEGFAGKPQVGFEGF
jgi:hypothetical protein